MRGRLGAALLVTAALSSCGVVGGGSPNPCQQTIPSACGAIAHCVLADNESLSGQFPGSQSFVVRAAAPQMVTFSFAFDNRVASGTMLTLTSTEPDCTEQSTYMTTSDIFKLAGATAILSFPITMTQAGDHLIQFTSDAYCSYQLTYQ